MVRSALIAAISLALTAFGGGANNTARRRRPERPCGSFWWTLPIAPTRPTIMTAEKQTTHEVKHFASTWGASLFWYFNEGADCQVTDLTTTVVDPPSHGRFSQHDGTIAGLANWPAPFPKGDPRAACPNLAMRNGAYQPDLGFTGRDRMTISFREGDTTFTDAIEVDVRRAVRPNPLASVGPH